MKELDFRTELLPQKNRLYRLAMGILLDSAEAEDTVEDTLLRAWEESRKPDAAPIQNLPAYLTTVCRRLALDRAQRLQAQAAPFDEAPDLPDESEPNPQDETYRRVVALIHQLREPQRSCLLLRDVEGLSYQEIAAALALTEAQVKTNIHRGRQRVREAFQS